MSEVARLQDVFPDELVTASNRAGMVYTDADPERLARRLDGNPAVDVVLWREGGEAVARRDGAELRFTPTATSGDAAILDHPDGSSARWAALANPNAGELIVSAAPGWEFADLAGRHHSGGGSHGSLTAGDSEVPMLTVGLDAHAGLDRRGDARRARPLRRPRAALRAHADEGMNGGPELAKLMAVRGIRDERVLAALAAVPRELFVPEQLRRNAYADRALPIGSGQTISQPFMVATMLEALRLDGRRGCSRSARAPATRRRCSRSSPTRS